MSVNGNFLEEYQYQASIQVCIPMAMPSYSLSLCETLSLGTHLCSWCVQVGDFFLMHYSNEP